MNFSHHPIGFFGHVEIFDVEFYCPFGDQPWPKPLISINLTKDKQFECDFRHIASDSIRFVRSDISRKKKLWRTLECINKKPCYFLFIYRNFNRNPLRISLDWLSSPGGCLEHTGINLYPCHCNHETVARHTFLFGIFVLYIMAFHLYTGNYWLHIGNNICHCDSLPAE